MDRYFVVVFARDPDAMRGLQRFDFDLFAPTAKRSGRDREYPFSIDGLLSTEEIETLRQAGYRVQVQDPAEKRARGAQAPAEFSQWMRGVQATITRERTAAARARASAAKKAKRKKPVRKKPVRKKPVRKKRVPKKRAAAKKPRGRTTRRR
jgi:hypothetical protein